MMVAVAAAPCVCLPAVRVAFALGAFAHGCVGSGVDVAIQNVTLSGGTSKCDNLAVEQSCAVNARSAVENAQLPGLQQRCVLHAATAAHQLQHALIVPAPRPRYPGKRLTAANIRGLEIYMDVAGTCCATGMLRRASAT